MIRAGLSRFSPPDWLFYPGAALAGVLTVALAFSLRPPDAVPEVDGGSVVLEGRALNEVLPGPGVRVDFIPRSDSGPVIRVRADETIEVGGRLFPGAAVPVPAEIEAAAIGRRVRFEVELRRVDSDLERIQIGYFTATSGASGWIPQPVGDRYATVAIEFDVPAGAAADGREWAGVWPDPEGRGRAVLIRRMAVSVVEPEPEPDAAIEEGPG